MTLTCCASLDATNRVVSFFPTRPQGLNFARDYSNIDNAISNPSSFSCSLALTKSFRPERIAQCLLGDDILECKSTFTISGSQVTPKRAKNSWLADYFYLPTDFVSIINIKPRVSNTILDASVTLNLDWLRFGSFLRIHAPFVYTSWDLNLKECLIKNGVNDYDSGYFNPTGAPRSQLLSQFLCFMQGDMPPSLSGITVQPLQKARMFARSQHTKHIADIHATLAIPWYTKNNIQCGMYLHGVIPTSDKPTGNFLFEPLIGNGGHYECGIGIYGHYCFWNATHTDESCIIFLDSYFTHLFKTSQTRSFDLKNGPNSRYMLAQRFEPTITDNLSAGNGIMPTHQFKHEYTTVANLTTMPVDISGAHHIDIAIRFVYTKEHINWHFGYEFWARTCETITVCKPTPLDNTDVRWALKGDARTFGFIGNDAIPLSATQNRATITNGLNKQTNTINNNIDNPQRAFAHTPAQPVTNTPNGTTQLFTSIQPLLLDSTAIDLRSAQTEGISHKIFSHVQFNAKHHAHAPYFSFGAEIEFGRKAGPTPTKELDACINCALSQWGIWLKGGFSF